MSTAPDFLMVDEHVARNPIARAIARTRLERATALFATRLYLLAEGEQVQSDGVATGRILYVAYLLMDNAGQSASPAARVIRGGISAVEQLALRGWRWHTADAAAIDQALQHAKRAVQDAPQSQTQRAWADLYRIEARIDAERAAAAAA